MKKHAKEVRIIRGYLGDLSLREAAELFSEVVPEKFSPSHQSIANWLEGKSLPPTDLLLNLALSSDLSDWRAQFGVDLLALTYPGLFTSPYMVARLALEKSERI